MRRFIFLVLSIGFVLPVFSQRNSVVAHRGAWKEFHLPENSIASLKKAIQLECVGSEFDVRITKDGRPVVYHDAEINHVAIDNLTFKQLSEQKLSNGERVPTLREYLFAGMNQSVTKLVLEIKSSKLDPEKVLELTRKCVALVKELEMEEMVEYISFSIEACKEVVKLDPQALVSYVNWKADFTAQQLSNLQLYGVDFNYKVFKEQPGLINDFRKVGIKLNTWTVNESTDLKWFIGQDFDYITTDEPAKLLSMLKEK